jgi:hypothetical protein
MLVVLLESGIPPTVLFASIPHTPLGIVTDSTLCISFCVSFVTFCFDELSKLTNRNFMYP